MWLSEIAQIANVSVVRDGEFNNLGLLSHRDGRVLAGYYEQRFERFLQTPGLACVISSRELAPHVPIEIGLAIAHDVKLSFYGLHEYLCGDTGFYWKDFKTDIAADARIHESAYIAPSNVRIGSRTIVAPRAIILERSIIGSDCRIHSGAVIGGEGFEPKWVAEKHVLIPHAGGVKIGDFVHIMCGAHIARAVFGGFTEIGDGSIVDALVHIAHNAKIGRNCEIAANALVAGSTAIGDSVWIGPNACVSSEVRVGDHAFISLGSVVIEDVPDRGRVSGYFAFDHRAYKRSHRMFRRASFADDDAT
jgi:UDP-3-O-[3-hydroxymyristoyl] glucosamine N-acyltransferase